MFYPVQWSVFGTPFVSLLCNVIHYFDASIRVVFLLQIETWFARFTIEFALRWKGLNSIRDAGIWNLLITMLIYQVQYRAHWRNFFLWVFVHVDQSFCAHRSPSWYTWVSVESYSPCICFLFTSYCVCSMWCQRPLVQWFTSSRHAHLSMIMLW